MPLQIRRGTNAQRVAMTQALAAGELLYVTDDQRLYVGNGSTLGGLQITGYTDENAVDAVGVALAAGTHTGITFTYGTTQDNANRIDAVISYPSLLSNLNLNSYNINGTGNISIAGNITAGAISGDFKGSLFADNSTALVNGVDASINLDGTVKGDIIPDATLSYDIGSSAARFKDLYLSGSSIYLGSAVITSTSTAVNLPAGSTIGGVGIGTVTGVTDIKGSVFGDDSVTLVNAVDGSLSTGTITLQGAKITSTTNALSIGDVSNAVEVDMFSGATTSFANMTGLTNGTSSPWVNAKISRGTLASPASLNTGDVMSGTLFFGYDGTGYSRSVAITTRVTSGATISAGLVPGDLAVYVQSAKVGAVAGDNLEMSFNGYGTLSAPTMKVGSYTSSPDIRPTGEIGMIIYNTTTNKFQGYNNTGWVDIS